MEALQPMNQHRPIGVIQHVSSYLHNAVRPDPNQMCVERRVVELAERQTVRDNGSPEWIRVRHDVRGFKQFIAPKATDGAVMLIGMHHTLAELGLVEALPEQASDVPSSNVRLVHLSIHRSKLSESTLIHTHSEGEAPGIITDDIDGPLRSVQAGHDTVKVDQWHMVLHCLSETDVLMMLRVTTSISITQETIGTERVVVGASLAVDHDLGRNAQRN